jgi:hypothetical protein
LTPLFKKIPNSEKKFLENFGGNTIFINKEYIMKRIIRLTETDLSRIVKRVIEESKSTPTKREILGMSKDELKDVYGDLEVKGSYLGKKGTFHHFKKTSLGDVVCSFRTDDTTPSGLKRNTQALKVKSDDVKFK